MKGPRTESAKRPIALALCRALAEDPFYRTIAGAWEQGTSAFETALVRYFEYALDDAEATGKLVVDDGQLGGAAWSLPTASGIDHKIQREKERFLRETLGDYGFSAYRRITKFMRRRSRACVPADAWYLSIIGIAPQMQGLGLGQKLLKPTLAEADAVAVGCYLETFSTRNVPFYARLGFDVVGMPHEPTTDARYSIMLRRPRPVSSSTAPDQASTS